MIDRILGIGKGETVADVLGRHRGIGPGFDLLRIALALYIFYGHTLWIAGGSASVEGVAAFGAATATAADTVTNGGFSGWTRPFHVAAVPVFFALSGFLVIGSAMRLRTTSTFLAFRFLRIFPALVVETLLCAFLLGAALTTLPVTTYFSDPVFWRYLGNMAGFVTFHLPGVFESNPVEGIVNTNLWTLPAEFHCYLLTAVLMLSRVIYNRNAYTFLYAVVGLAFLVASLTVGFSVTDRILSPLAITFYFFTGILFYHWREKLPVDWRLFFVAGAIGYALLLFKWSVFIAPLFVTYCMVFVGMVAVPKLPLISKGDYSYGIYLYGFPITQALVTIFPTVFIGRGVLLLFASTLVTSIFAAFSWHVIEHRCLQLKRHLPARWFPTPVKVIRQSPKGRIDQAEIPANASPVPN